MSILDPRNKSAIDSRGYLHGSSGKELDERKRKARKVSDLIIRSNYFSTNKK